MVRGGAGEEGVDAGEEFDGGDFASVHDASQSIAPGFRGAAFFAGKEEGGLGKTTADGELPAGAAQPCLEVGAVGLGGEHGEEDRGKGKGGEGDF